VSDYANDAVKVYDVGDPSSAEKLSEVSIGSPLNMDMFGNYLVVAGEGADEIALYDTSTPTDLKKVGSVSIGSVDHIENSLTPPVELESASSVCGQVSKRHGR